MNDLLQNPVTPDMIYPGKAVNSVYSRKPRHGREQFLRAFVVSPTHVALRELNDEGQPTKAPPAFIGTFGALDRMVHAGHMNHQWSKAD